MVHLQDIHMHSVFLNWPLCPLWSKLLGKCLMYGPHSSNTDLTLRFTLLIKAGSDQTTCTSSSLTGPVSASSVRMTPAHCGRYNVFLGQLLLWEALLAPCGYVWETDFVMLYELCSVCPFCENLHYQNQFSHLSKQSSGGKQSRKLECTI